MTLWVYMREPCVRTLGVKNRYGLWVSGCNRNCEGCTVPQSHDMHSGTPIDTDALLWEILASGADGITISGGEPFLQAKALADLLEKLRQKKFGGVIVYTGYQYEELLTMDADTQELLSLTDLLVDGEYIKKLDDGKALRGSSNQRAIPLTDRYLDCVQQYGTGNRQTEIMRHAGFIHEIGIPTNSQYTVKGELHERKNILNHHHDNTGAR